MMCSAGLCGRFALGTLLETWQTYSVFETNVETYDIPQNTNIQNCQVWHQHKIRIIYDRLPLKSRLFRYRHHPKMHEMVSDRSSRAENWTDLPKISMRVFFDSNKFGKMAIWSKKTQKCRFSWKKIFEKLHGPYQSCKIHFIRYNLLKFNKFHYLYGLTGFNYK
mgnify:CR=1 FL=1